MDPCKARYRHEANFGGQSLTVRRKVKQRYPWVSTPGLTPCSQKSQQQVVNYFSPSTTGKVVPVSG